MACVDWADSEHSMVLGRSYKGLWTESHQLTQTACNGLQTEEVWTPPEQEDRETSSCKYLFFFLKLTSAVSSL